jgi:glutamate carboxypeptidase
MATTDQRGTELHARALARRAEYLGLLERLVMVESPSHDAAAGQRLADLLAEELQGRGWEVAREPAANQGDILVARKAGGDGPATLLLAHYDTVWPLATLQAQPWRVDAAEDRAYGPGTFDMKAGIGNSLLAVALLEEQGVPLPGPVTLLLTSDEETGSHASRSRIEGLAREHDRVFVVEPAREDGALKIGRKGTAIYRIDLQGVSAHAGNHPEDGASALVELAHLTLFARSLDHPGAATSVNPTVAHAGGAVNVITEHAHLAIDCRVLRLSEAERVDASLRNYQPRDPRVRIDIRGGLNRPPMEPTPASLALFERARAILHGWGREVESAIVGGGSDGNFTAALGIPTLDGVGACGAGAHARHEHIRIRDTLERCAMLAALIGDPSPA